MRRGGSICFLQSLFSMTKGPAPAIGERVLTFGLDPFVVSYLLSTVTFVVTEFAMKQPRWACS